MLSVEMLGGFPLLAGLDPTHRDYAALRDANAYERLIYISKLTDTSLLNRTWDDFQPAVPLTLEGLVFTVIGYLAGYGALGAAMGLRFRRRMPLLALKGDHRGSPLPWSCNLNVRLVSGRLLTLARVHK